MINQIQIEDYRNERVDIHYRRECEINIDELRENFNGMSIEINKKKELRQLEQAANLKQAANLSTYSTKPSRRFNSFYDDDDDYEECTIPLNEIISQIPPFIAIIPILPTVKPEDSLMGNEELRTILENESNELIKSSVEDLVPIPSESEDTSGSDSEYDLSSYDDFSPIDVPEGKSVLEDIECKDSYDPNRDESTLLVTSLSDSNDEEYFTPGDDVKLLLHQDPSIPKMSVASILEGFTDESP
nr:hypothetical protein [Tanacetum cinerariifolium]